VDAAHGDCCCGSEPPPGDCCGPQPYQAGLCRFFRPVVVGDSSPVVTITARADGFDRVTTSDGSVTTIDYGFDYLSTPRKMQPNEAPPGQCDTPMRFGLSAQAVYPSVQNPLNSGTFSMIHGGGGAVVDARDDTVFFRVGPATIGANDSNLRGALQARSNLGQGAEHGFFGTFNTRTGVISHSAKIYGQPSIAALRAFFVDPGSGTGDVTGTFAGSMNGCNPRIDFSVRFLWDVRRLNFSFLYDHYEGDVTLSGSVVVTGMCSTGNRPGGCANCPDDGAEVVPA